MQDRQDALMHQLKPYLPVDQRRLRLVSQLLIALLKLSDAGLSQWSRALEGNASQPARYKQLHRFMRYFRFSQRIYAQLIWQRYGQGQQVVLTLDRTEWYMRGQWVQVLVLGIAHQGLSIPLLWQTHNRRGNSPVTTRNAMLRALQAWIQPRPEQQLWWTADREFMGKPWFGQLTARGMHFCIRLRHNLAVGQPGHTQLLYRLFQCRHWRVLRKPRWVSGQWLYLSGCQLATGEYVLLGSATPKAAYKQLYEQRWQIETLFGAFKSRGFQLGHCRLTHPKRIQTLLFVLSIGICWAVAVGEWLLEQGRSIPLLKQPTRQVTRWSLFRWGRDYLQDVLLNNGDYNRIIALLSCT